jgi:hypothetical protein
MGYEPGENKQRPGPLAASVAEGSSTAFADINVRA